MDQRQGADGVSGRPGQGLRALPGKFGRRSDDLDGDIEDDDEDEFIFFFLGNESVDLKGPHHGSC